MNTLKTNWSAAFTERSFKVQFSVTFLFLGIMLPLLSYFFAFIEARPSYKVNDIVLNLLNPIDVSLFTFLIIYCLAIYTIIAVIRDPKLFLKAVQAYALMLFIRLITMYLVPLEAPQGIIPLHDPFIEQFFYGQVRITKDLFFSGHVATVTLLYLVNPDPKRNWVYVSGIISVSVLILLQHVHYSFDILAAPFFSWGAWKVMSSVSAAKTEM